MIRFLFRRPKFPVICDVKGDLIAARTPKQLFERIIEMNISLHEGLIPVIDATAEGWVLSIDNMTVSPFTFKKSWTKKEIIKLFNESKTAKRADLEYSFRSLSAKRLDRILCDIVNLILQANKPLQQARKKAGER